MNANEIDQPVGDQGNILMLRIEQLPHRYWSAALLANQTKMIVLLGRQRILDEVGSVPFKLLTEGYCLARTDPLMHIMQKLDIIAQFDSQVLEERWDQPDIRSRIPGRSRIGWPIIVPAAGTTSRAAATCSVGRLTRHRDLNPDVAVAALHCLPCVVFNLLEVTTARMKI